MFKYIRTKNEGFILWSARDTTTHYDMAQKFGGKSAVVSAGFVTRDLKCRGESISLGISSRFDDTESLAEESAKGYPHYSR
jgi:hypothetical protein